MRRQRFPVMLSAQERRALQALAGQEGLSSSALVRRLIHHEAQRRSLWPLTNTVSVAQERKPEPRDSAKEKTPDSTGTRLARNHPEPVEG